MFKDYRIMCNFVVSFFFFFFGGSLLHHESRSTVARLKQTVNKYLYDCQKQYSRSYFYV